MPGRLEGGKDSRRNDPMLITFPTYRLTKPHKYKHFPAGNAPGNGICFKKAFLYVWPMKIINIIFCLVFVVSAVLQYNDPDPYVWIPIYLYGAVLCWLAFRGKFYPAAYLVGIIGFAGYALYFFFTENGVLDWISEHDAENIAASMQATKPWIEDTREFFGLLILIIALLVNFIYARKNQKLSLK